MSDPMNRLGAIARWLQREDDELLYRPDGAGSTPVTLVIESAPSHVRGAAYEIVHTTDDGGYFVPGELVAAIRAHGWVADRITVRPLPPHLHGAPGFQADCVVDGIDYHARAPSVEEACAKLLAFIAHLAPEERVRECYAVGAGQRVFLHYPRMPACVDVRGIGQGMLDFPQRCRTEYPATGCPCGEIRVEWAW